MGDSTMACVSDARLAQQALLAGGKHISHLEAGVGMSTVSAVNCIRYDLDVSSNLVAAFPKQVSCQKPNHSVCPYWTRKNDTRCVGQGNIRARHALQVSGAYKQGLWAGAAESSSGHVA